MLLSVSASAADSISDHVNAQCRSEAMLAMPRSEAGDRLAAMAADGDPEHPFGNNVAYNMLQNLDRQLEQDRTKYTRSCVIAKTTNTGNQ
jgi:hypothetical protein